MKNNQFQKAYLEIEKSILEDIKLKADIVAIALLGSAADGEESTKWSDLDVLVILKTDNLGNINIKSLDSLRQIAESISSKYTFPISILSHTVDDFENYVSFEYLKHYSFGNCTYPSTDFLMEKINNILANRDLSEKVRRGYCAYYMRHIRFNLLRKYVSNYTTKPDSTEEFAKLLIDKMIKVTDLALNYLDIWAKTKEEIYQKASKNLQIDTDTLKKALVLRKDWENISQSKLDKFIPLSLKYLNDCIDTVLTDYQFSTPEERMS